MEEIYPPDKFPCSDHIPLKRYFVEFSTICLNKPGPAINHQNKQMVNNAVLDSMQIFDQNKRNKLAKSCSIDLLIPKGKPTPKDTPSATKGGTRLKTKSSYTALKTAKQLKTVIVREEFIETCRTFYNLRETWEQEKRTIQLVTKNNKILNIEPKQEFAIAIRVYHPFAFTLPTEISCNSYRKLKFSHEIVILGSNTLADLRDKILCTADAGICTETEDLTVKPSEENAKNKYPSGFIFLDDVFYNDTRHENHIDYSEVILKWAEGKGIAPLKADTLQTTRMDELSPRFGYPYVYQHQAACEHILVFSDAWLLSRHDPLYTGDYPYYREIHPHGDRACTLCHAAAAKWICADSDRLPHTTFVCKKCLMQYQYKDGKKNGNFKMFPYFDHICNSAY